MSKKDAVEVAMAIVDYVSSRDVRYADKPAAMKRAYDHLVATLEAALAIPLSPCPACGAGPNLINGQCEYCNTRRLNPPISPQQQEVE